MEKKDKKILIITSGVFLIALAFILFFTMQSRDNMMESAGRYKGTEARLGDSSTIDNCFKDYWICPNYNVGGTCLSSDVINTQYTTLGESECLSQGMNWLNGKCYSGTKEKKLHKCETCEDNFKLNSNNDACSPIADFFCASSVTWHENSSIELATCDGCTLAEASSSTGKSISKSDYGTYTIHAQVDSGYVWEDGTTGNRLCTASIVCPNDMTWNNDTKKCESNSSSTVTCDPGEYLPGQSTSCSPCRPGYSCPGGTYRLGDSSPSGLTQCTGTTYASGGATTCETCTGTIVKNGNLNVGCTTDKVTCNPGEYLPGQSTSCSPCPAGYSCPGGTYRLGDSSPSGLTQCTGTTYASGGASTCSTCSGSIQKSGSLNVGCTNNTCMDAGVYLEDGTCHTCEKGFYCPDNDSYKYECGIGETTSSTGATSEDECVCDTGYHLSSDGRSCVKNSAYASLTCYTKKYTGSSQIIANCTNCTINTGSGYTASGSLARATNVDDYTITATPNSGYTFNGNSSCTAYINQDDSEIKTCCYMDGSVYKYGSVTSDRCVNDDNNYACLNRNKKTCCYITSNSSTNGWAYTYGETQADNCDHDSLNLDSTACLAQNDQCTISLSTSSKVTSIDDDTNSTNSYYTVNVSVSGFGCKGKTIEYEAENSKNVSPGSNVVSASTYSGSTTFSFNVYPKIPCSVSTAKAKVVGTNNSAQLSVDVRIKKDWHSTDVCTENPSPNITSSAQADSMNPPADVYYSDRAWCTNSSGERIYGYTKKWTRNDACDGGGGTPTPTKYCCRLENSDGNQYNSNQTSCAGNWKVYTGTCSETPACYLRTSDNKYVTGSFKDRDGYEPANSIKCTSTPTYCCRTEGSSGNTYSPNQASCTSPAEIYTGTCSETPACYLRTSDNKYVTGSFKDRDGYEPADSSKCSTQPVVEQKACYVKIGNGTENDYCYDIASNCVGYTLDKNETNCTLTRACYVDLNNNSYVYGDFRNQTSRYRYHGSSCPQEACYIKSDGTYEWTDSPSYGSKPSSIPHENCNNTAKIVCYVNGNRTDYKWTTECATGEYFDGTSCKTGTNSGSAYTVDSTINNFDACNPPENPACYINHATNNYEWGLFENTVGYESADESMCNWCYEDKNGKYVWGRHIGDSNYTPVDSIKCVTVNVPKTDLNVSTIIYVAIAVLSMFGIGFVAYANRKKKLYK